MSVTPVSTITRQATRKPGEKLNILTFPTHERYETNLAATGHNFYAYQADTVKGWRTDYAPVPPNYHLMDKNLGIGQIRLEVDFDIILSQNKAGQYPIGYQLSRQLSIPLLSLEHTLPMPQWEDDMLKKANSMRGDVDVFISDYSRAKWGFNEEARVIKHCIDTDVFCPPLGNFTRNNVILSVVNDWVNRDWCCGFKIWERVTKDLPVVPVGDTPGLSLPAKSVPHLVNMYCDSRIFINTSTVSPVPTALLEAMSCGCAVVSTDNCMIPEFIEHGVNGFMTNNEDEMRKYLLLLMSDEDLANKMGNAARKTVVEKCSKERFLREWNDAFYHCADVSLIRSQL